MAKTYRSYCPDQMLLLPPSLQDWLPENHLVYFVSDVVDNLDLDAIEPFYEKRGSGPASVSSQDDDEGFGIRFLCWDLFVPKDSKTPAGRCGIPSFGSW